MIIKPPFSYEVKCLWSLLKWLVERICSLCCIITSMFSTCAVLFGLTLILVFFSISSSAVNNLFRKNEVMLFEYASSFTQNWLNEGPLIQPILIDWLNVHSDEGLLGDPELYYSTNDTTIQFKVGVYFLSMMHFSRHVTNIGYSTVTGEFLISSLDSSFTIPPAILFTLSDEMPDHCCPYENENSTAGPVISNQLDEDFTFLQSKVLIPSFDARFTPWYQAVGAKSTLNYTDNIWVNYVTATGQIGSMISKNVYGTNGQYKGVMAFAYFLDRWNEIIHSLGVEPGIIFFIDQSDDGLLLASSSQETQITRTNPDTGALERIYVEETNHTVILDAVKYMKSKISATNSLTDIVTFHDVTFSSQGEKWYIRGQRIDVIGNFQILAVYVIRDKDVFSEIRFANTLSFIISSSLILFFLLFFVLAICLAFFPLKLLSLEMKKVETMNTSSVKFGYLSIWYFLEIRTLLKRFKRCVVELEKMKSFLPDGIVSGPNLEESDVAAISGPGQSNYSDDDEEEEEEREEEEEEEEEVNKIDPVDDGIPEIKEASSSGGSETNSSSSDGSSDLEVSPSSSDLGSVCSQHSYRSNHSSSSSSFCSTSYNKEYSFLKQKVRHRQQKRVPLECLPGSLDYREILTIHICIINKDELFYLNKNYFKRQETQYHKYMNAFTDFLSFVGKTMGITKKSAVRIVSFGIDHITICYVGGSKVVEGVKNIKTFVRTFEKRRAESNIKHRLEKHQRRKGGRRKGLHFTDFQLCISMSLENTILGRIGTKEVKNMVFCYGSVERARFLSDRFCNFFLSITKEINNKNKNNVRKHKNRKNIGSNYNTVFVFIDSNVKDLIIIRNLRFCVSPVDVCLRYFGTESESRVSTYLNSTHYETVSIFEVDFFCRNSKSRRRKRCVTGGFDACMNDDIVASKRLFDRYFHYTGINRTSGENKKGDVIRSIHERRMEKLLANDDGDRSLRYLLEVYKIRFIEKIVGYVNEKFEEMVAQLRQQQQIKKEEEEEKGYRSSDDNDDEIKVVASNYATGGCFGDVMEQNLRELEQEGYLCEGKSLIFNGKDNEGEVDDL